MSADFREAIDSYADFPKPGVLYWDSTALLRKPELFKQAAEELAQAAANCSATLLAAIEAKGFPLGGAVSITTGLPLVLVRKPELTPGDTRTVTFKKEYGEGRYQIKCGVVPAGAKVFLLYDILAGPGATNAARQLITSTGGEVCGAGYIIELGYLGGREALSPLPLYSLVKIGSPYYAA